MTDETENDEVNDIGGSGVPQFREKTGSTVNLEDADLYIFSISIALL